MERTIYIIISLISLIITLLLTANALYEYAIVAGAITFVCICCAIRYYWNNRSEESIYKSKVRNILNTYDSILITSDSLPDISEKNIVEVSSIDDLLDAQIELKKPIYYKEFEDHTVFVLIDNEEACVAVFKLHPESTSPYELYLREKKNKKKKEKNPKSILEDLEDTTIIRLSDEREFKVSPIRKKKKIVTINPNSCMINKESVRLISKDESVVSIAIEDIIEVDYESDDKKRITELYIITEAIAYCLTTMNPKKLAILRSEIEKRLKNFGK